MGTSPRVLVVDDEPGIRQGCRRVLEPLGYEVVQAETIREGLELIEESLFALALIDVMLPDGRGVDLLEPILSRDPSTICIIITGYATVELAVQAIKKGAYDFLAKPFDADLLEITVRQGIERRQLTLEARRSQALETRLREVEQEKAQLARLDQFKTNFMWMMAHELRSPLSAAQSLLRTLLQGIGDPLTGNQDELLRRVETRLDNLQALVSDLLALASSKNPELVLKVDQMDFGALLESVASAIQPNASEKGVTLHLSAPSTPWMINSSSESLRTIFSNLVDNAVKYTPAGGRVDIHAYAQDNCIETRISDTGIGIPAAVISRLGEEFFRAPNARHSGLPGTGLGLSIVKQILDRLGGRMDIESKLDQGTTITVWIPAGQEARNPD